MRKFYQKIIFLLFGGASFLTSHSVCAGNMQIPGQRADTLKGLVVDENGKPLAGVRVRYNEKDLTSTDKSGKFAVLIDKRQKLSFNLPGYYNNEPGALVSPAIVSLKTDITHPSDSLSVLFEKKSSNEILGSVAAIGGPQLLSSPVPSLFTALQGRLAGLNIGQSTGYPGTDGDALGLSGQFSATIRGYSGRVSSGATDLMVLIDGAVRPYRSVDPADIESVSLLKDAISTVMMGQRSTPGMLVITTRKGDPGTTRIGFSLETAVQRPLSFLQPLSAFDYANLYDQTQINNGVAPASVKYSTVALNAYQSGSDPYLYPNVDWRSTILKNSVSQNKINFNIQGSGPTVRYFVSLNYLKDYGLFNTSDLNDYNTSPDYARFSVRSNVDVAFNNTLKMGIGVYGQVEDQTQPGNNDAASIFSGIFTTPALAYPITNPNGTFGGNSNYTTNLYARSVRSGYSLTNTKNLSFDLSLTQRLDKWINGLYLKASTNINAANQYSTNRLRSYAVVPISAGASSGYTYGNNIGTNSDIPLPVAGTTSGGAVYRQNSSYFEGLAGYDHKIGEHSLEVKLVADQWQTIRNADLPYVYNTFAANGAYNFKQKYFLEVAGSYGSFNQFAPAHQYEPFYAVAAGWNLAKEDFFKKNLDAVNNFKVRVNYGKTGYVNRGSYSYFSYIQRYGATGTYYYFGSSNNGSPGFAEAGLSNPDAEGEKAKKLNAGIDIGLWSNHLTISADYFRSELYDIWLVPSAVYQVLGLNPSGQNVGRQNYTGYEFTAGYHNAIRGFNYFADLNLSLLNSKLLYQADAPVENAYQSVVGLPVGISTGLTAIGLFKSASEIASAAIPNDVSRSAIQPGDIRYLDRNGDGIIDNRDVGPIGLNKPQIFFGLNFGFNYKGIDFSALIQGVGNRQVYRSGDYEWAFRNNGLNNAYSQNLNAYSASNPDGQFPRLTIGTNTNNEKTSSFWLHDAGYARLKNAQLGYTLPSDWTRRVRIPSLRLFVSGENLLTWSQLNDFGFKPDPEVSGTNYPLFRTFNLGVNVKL